MGREVEGVVVLGDGGKELVREYFEEVVGGGEGLIKLMTKGFVF